MTASRPELDQTDTIAQLPLACCNEQAAVEFLERNRWGGCPKCPECEASDVYAMRDRATGDRSKRYLWRCRDCKRQFTVRTGTVYEESLVPLHKWCRVLWEASTCKNGVSALEISRKVQVTYKTALFMLHRVRHAMTPNPDGPKLVGTVEADETYVGARKPRYPSTKKGRRKGAEFTKTPVFAVVQRGGEVRTRVMANVTAANVTDALLENVSPDAHLVTDQLNVYKGVGKPFKSHRSVLHNLRQYVDPKDSTCHTNTVEGFWARVKRKLNGTHHAVSREHLHRYITEAAFLYNTRGMNDGERTIALIKKTEGKRLRYKTPA
jgi:transposase-like protein